MATALDRRDIRYQVRIPAVILHSRRGEIPVLTGDVSFRGAFLRTDAPPHARQLVSVRFQLPAELGGDGATLTLTAMVVHVVPPGDAQGRAPGAGIEFYGVGADTRARWERLVQTIQKLQPGSAETPAPAVDPVQRRHTRRRLEVEVLLSTASDTALFDRGAGETQDISEGGMFVLTDLSVGVGEGVIVKLVDPTTQRTFPVECVVRRRVFGTGAGLGVEFLDMTPEKWQKLVDFLKPVARLQPERPRALSGGHAIVL